jgi:hypothetical protein
MASGGENRPESSNGSSTLLLAGLPHIKVVPSLLLTPAGPSPDEAE